MNQFFPVCVAFLATLFLSAIALPLHAEGAEPPDAQKNVVPNRTIIIPFRYDAMKAEQEDATMIEHAPIIRLWESGSRTNPADPFLYFALWHDGTVIWSKSDDQNLAWSRNGTEHFQSKISEKQVEDFLLAFDKVGFLEFSGKIAPMKAQVGPGLNTFFLQTENVQFCFGMDSIRWADIPAPPTRREEGHQMADKWRAVLGLLLELIPEKGEQISLSIESDRDKRQDVITPVPLRQKDRPQDNGNVKGNGNWGQVPLRPR